jgi:hypothetical protein
LGANSQPGTSLTDVHAKALAVNLDPTTYGTIAEIGAGQEVARWFLTVGGASGTVAQTISAYDKTFSDATYGAGTRYVSKERLLAMLDREYRLLIDRLGPDRGAGTRFFAFADTASSRNYKGDNEQHAWVGLRFQHEPGADPSDILLHVNLADPTAQLQQQALGVLGVNLIHATFFQRSGSPDEFLGAVWDELSLERLEVDVVDLRGPALAAMDDRALCLKLVRRGMCRAVVFDGSGRVVEPSSVLRKRPLVVERGLFATAEPFHAAMLRASERQLRAEGVPLGRDPAGLLELSLAPVTGAVPDDAEALVRVDRLVPLGAVAVTGLGETYLVAEYLRRYTTEPIRFALGVSLLARVLDEQFYDTLPGRLLEGLGKLFAENIKVHVYPMRREDVVAALGPRAGQFRIGGSDGSAATADDIQPAPPVDHLYRYVRAAGLVIPVAVDRGESGEHRLQE